MVVDSSAFVAILSEPDGELYAKAIRGAESVTMSAMNVYETRVVLSGKAARAAGVAADVRGEFETWLDLQLVEVVPFDADQAVLAHRAYLRFGKGFHAAGLNLADCAAYALATSRGEPLLFKGDDFGRTDVASALDWGWQGPARLD